MRKEAVERLGDSRVFLPKPNTSGSHCHRQLKLMNLLEIPLFPSTTSLQRKLQTSSLSAEMCVPAVELEIVLLLKKNVSTVV